MLGLLFQAGFRINDVLDMTLPQCREVVASIVLARGRFVDALLSPVVEGLGEVSGSGATWKPSRKGKPRAPEQREADLLGSLKAAGIPID